MVDIPAAICHNEENGKDVKNKMKPQSQMLLIALAILFAIALALTIAMLCVSALQKETETAPEPVYPPEWTQPFISNEPAETTLPVPVETETTEIVTVYDSGLRFVSNRDGTWTLTGIGSDSDPFVIIPDQSPLGDTVTAIATRALMGCEFITAIQIPETVEWIGELAFANCPNLLYIAVSKYNPCFKDVDGVLYTAEEDRLLLYPPMHTGNTFYLPATVSEIADMAFYQCAYLSTVRYEGTAEQWHMIQIGAKNYSLTAASVIFSVRNAAQ